ncbi:MAG: HD-GYP domain-containing protein [Holophagaceae bacterium]|nr:HD-GYP domain-containing protein [Holophagaceae bacterium]
MIKKVNTSDLKVGMFIHDLNVPWLQHNFASNRFMLLTEKQIEKIVKLQISDVLIDTSKGRDATHAPTKEEAESELMEMILDIASEPDPVSKANNLEMQWAESKQIHTEAVKVVSDVLTDARIGKHVSVEKAAPIVSDITKAVLGNDGTLVSLCRIKQRDSYTFQHSVSISALLVTFCNAVGGYSEDELHEIGLGGLFHDVGKMRIPNQILNKPGKLSDSEFAVMRSHVTEGVEYLRAGHSLSESTMKIVEEHHERFDGSGYPRGISRSAISRIGQMASIVDVYDAITSIRVYHKALEPINAMQLIYEWGGKHFDNSLVHQFIKGVGIYPVGSLVRLESARLAVVLRQGQNNLLKPLVRLVFDTRLGYQLPPTDLDLATPSCQDIIVGYEVPTTWGIDPFHFIGKGK